MEKDKRISAKNFLKLIDIFEEKGWAVHKINPSTESRFDRFCKRLCCLSNDEQELVIDLTKNFLYIGGQEYIPIILKLLTRMQKDNPFYSKNKIIVLPLIAPKDKNKTKSSSSMWYNFQDEQIKTHPLFSMKKLIYYDPSNYEKLKNLNQDDIVVLLDDYIGSGETANEALTWLSNQYGIPCKQIVLLTIAAQEQGVSNILNQRGVSIYTYYTRKKGISDYYLETDLKMNHIKTMNSIENKLDVSEKFHFGYNESEALISLIKTPNNTFPVFWMTNNKHEYAPFLRNTNE